MALYHKLRRLARHLEVQHDVWVGTTYNIAPYVFDQLVQMVRSGETSFHIHGRSYCGAMSAERRLVEEYGWLKRVNPPGKKGYIMVEFARAPEEVEAIEAEWEKHALAYLTVQLGLDLELVGTLDVSLDAIRFPEVKQ